MVPFKALVRVFVLSGCNIVYVGCTILYQLPISALSTRYYSALTHARVSMFPPPYYKPIIIFNSVTGDCCAVRDLCNHHLRLWVDIFRTVRWCDNGVLRFATRTKGANDANCRGVWLAIP